ncbi:hypothetical protein SAMN05428642_102543 [Flaviramulus basaltis]|uniref:Lipocalin-like domain-containing protein n=1 Tax=Flaviramulus basaltis TaxID=369401 RepID=A0A1K2II68_9FLAO|nr:hypothetical protein [Flaviramulus basaltis]SFZ92124.1 hypothetical protein SAMN05428642_102543 [Flaviramulus basaltis]
MKFYFTTLLVAFFLISCKNDKMSDNKTVMENNDNQPSLVGVWQMVGYYNYNDNKIVDSFMSSETYKQIKIYTPTKVMWSRLNKQDSTDWFGFGNYKITDNTLTENLVYGSNTMNKTIEKNNEFNFELVLNEDTYNQIELDENGDRILSENYIRIE